MEVITGQLTPWHWMTVGVIFFVLELFAPTTVLFWPAIAAIATGIIAFLIPALGWQLQVALFAALAIAMTFIGRYFFKNKFRTESADNTLNKRGDSLKGRTITLSEPIVNGVGSVTIDSTRWRLVGPDAPKGSTLKVVGMDGSSLIVEATDN